MIKIKDTSQFIPVSFFLFAVFLFLQQPVYSQQEPFHNFSCGTIAPSSNHSRFTISNIGTHTGAHLPVSDTIRALVVYVQMPTDNLPDEYWERGHIPIWWKKYADTLNNFFREMSFGKLTLTCETHPRIVIPPRTEADYLDAKQNYGTASKDIIALLDREYDFTRFDLWHAQDHPYTVYKAPDGRVDLVIMIYRNVGWTTFLPFAGVSDLGFEGYVFVDSMKRFFYGGNGTFSDAASSGVTVTKKTAPNMVTDFNYAFGISAHEIMHKIYGEGHPARLFGGLGLLGASGAGLGLCGFERHVLGMIRMKEIPYGVDTVLTLHDYMTTGDAYIVPIPQRNYLYYSFEYRRKLSQYDTAPIPGIYIYRIDDAGSRNQKEVIVQSADGRFQWRFDSTLGRPVKYYPDLLTGYNKLQAIPMNGKNTYAWGWWGDEYDAFTMKNRYFSWWRNPSPDFAIGIDTIRTGLDCTVLSMNDSTATIAIRFGSQKILNIESNQDNSFFLNQNYPNPVALKSSTSIQFSLPKESNVRLSVFNIFGQHLSTIIESREQSGLHEVQLETSNLSAGTYIYTLDVEGKRQQRLMQIVE